jgi:NitT/TauT family transport system substrate-binding protein
MFDEMDRRKSREVSDCAMKILRQLGLLAGAGLALLSPAFAYAQADKLVVTHYAAALNGLPYAVAMEKGYFREAGVNITGVIGAAGGGSGVRSLLAGGSFYGEVALPAAITAARQGFDVKIINACGEGWDQIWVTRPDRPLNSVQDLRGKRIAYSRPKSVSETFIFMLLDKLGLKRTDVTMLAVGADSAGATAVEQGAADLTLMTEPFYSMQLHNGIRYKVVFYAKDVLPPVTQTVGITTAKFAKLHAKELQAIIAARRKGVEFIYSHPAETAVILARAYNLPPQVATGAIQTTLQKFGKWWSPGNFNMASMEEVVHAMHVSGELTGPVDWSAVINQDLLPADLRRKVP